MTNADMILRLIQLHLPGFLSEIAGFQPALPEAFCVNAVCADKDTPVEDCLACLRRWLERPYDGRFTMRGGRFVIREEDGNV